MYLEIVRKECTWEGSGGLPDSQQASLVCSSAASAMLSFVITLAGAYKQVTNIYKSVTPNGKNHQPVSFLTKTLLHISQSIVNSQQSEKTKIRQPRRKKWDNNT